MSPPPPVSACVGRGEPPPRPPSPVPAPCGVGPFAPLRVRGGGADRLRRMLRRQRRAAAAGLALAGAALATTGLSGGDGEAHSAQAPPDSGRASVRLVSAPVRIADPETVRLLRPGDRVDVIAVGGAGDEARVVARGARVAKVPGAPAGVDTGRPGAGASADGVVAAEMSDVPDTSEVSEVSEVSDGTVPGAGALVVLSVERSTATALLGAGVSGRLAVAVSDEL
ncbi:hypothetical protein ACFXOL_29100 [Streptomyces californicus]|uniref:hypothetical protein n=1 Tax=Streptomyces TaxID=1883 RepID=UPI00359C222A